MKQFLYRLPGDKLARCLLCPAAFHATTFCTPAGCEILGGSQVNIDHFCATNKTNNKIKCRFFVRDTGPDQFNPSIPSGVSFVHKVAI